MNYPLISEYIEAIKSAEDNFEELSYLRPVLGDDGLPVMTSGNFAVVFKMKDKQSGKFYAVKCFTKGQEGRAEAYREIAKELKDVSSPYLVSIQYLEKELFVDTEQTDETEFPVLLMDWVEGKTLDKYLRENLGDKYALEMLAYRFSQLAQWLIPQPFAHGDLKPDNILVHGDGTLVLVDYDGMYVPAMEGQKARELGSPDFRHPSRTEIDFDEHIDDFPLASILLSLKSISIDNQLLNKYGAEDRLLLSKEDYRNIGSSDFLKEIFPSQDNVINNLVSMFMLACSNKNLQNMSISFFDVQKPAPYYSDNFDEFSFPVTAKDLVDAIEDEYGVKYSKDEKKLLTIPSSFPYSTYQVKDGTEVICDKAFERIYPKYHFLKEVRFPSSLLHIGNSAFLWSQGLEHIELPSRLKSIGDQAFAACGNLKRIELPKSLKFLGCGCFNNSGIDILVIPENVEQISGSPLNKKWTETKIVCNSNKFKVKNNCLYSADEKAIIATFDKSNINSSVLEGVNYIGGYAFAFCKVEELNIPLSVRNIGKSAFYDSMIERIEIPSSVSSIGEYAFSHTKLKEIAIPGSIAKLDKGLFSWCKHLKKAIISDSVKVLEKEVFSECENLQEVELPNTIISIGNSAFFRCIKLDKILLQDGIKQLGSHVFQSCINLKSIIIPSSVDFIGDNPFEGCNCVVLSHSPRYIIRNGILYSSNYIKVVSCLYNSEEIDILNTVEEIGNSAFSGCFSLRKISLPNSLKRIGSYAFADCASLKSITIPKSVGSIGSSLCLNCSELEEIRILSRNVKIDTFQFTKDCDLLKVILIPNGSYSYFYDMFEKQGWLRNILVEGTKKTIFNPEDKKSIIEELHKNNMFGVVDLEK